MFLSRRTSVEPGITAPTEDPKRAKGKRTAITTVVPKNYNHKSNETELGDRSHYPSFESKMKTQPQTHCFLVGIRRVPTDGPPELIPSCEHANEPCSLYHTCYDELWRRWMAACSGLCVASAPICGIVCFLNELWLQHYVPLCEQSTDDGPGCDLKFKQARSVSGAMLGYFCTYSTAVCLSVDLLPARWSLQCGVCHVLSGAFKVSALLTSRALPWSRRCSWYRRRSSSRIHRRTRRSLSPWWWGWGGEGLRGWTERTRRWLGSITTVLSSRNTKATGGRRSGALLYLSSQTSWLFVRPCRFLGPLLSAQPGEGREVWGVIWLICLT